MFKKILSIALCLTMLCVMLPLGVHASGTVTATEARVSGDVYKLVFSLSGSTTSLSTTISFDSSVTPVDAATHSPSNGSAPFKVLATDSYNGMSGLPLYADGPAWSGNSVTYTLSSGFRNNITNGAVFEFYYKTNANFRTDSIQITSNGAAVTPTIPVTGVVSIAKTSTTVGSTFTANLSGLRPSGAACTYQWYRDGAPITAGTASPTYVLTNDDAGRSIKVRVSSGNYYFESAPVATTAIQGISALTLNVGSTVTANNSACIVSSPHETTVGGFRTVTVTLTAANGYRFNNDLNVTVLGANTKLSNQTESSCTVTIEMIPSVDQTVALPASPAVGQTLNAPSGCDVYEWFGVADNGSEYKYSDNGSSFVVGNSHVGKRIRYKAYNISPLKEVPVLVAMATSANKVPKLVPQITAQPTVGAYSYGQKLSANQLIGGSATVAGRFEFVNPTMQATTGYATVRFVPTDTAAYDIKNDAGSVAILVNTVAPRLDFDFTSDYVNIGQATTVTIVPQITNPSDPSLRDFANPTLIVRKNFEEYYRGNRLSFTTEASDALGTRYEVTLIYPSISGKYTEVTAVKYFDLEEDPSLPARAVVLAAVQALDNANIENASASYAEVTSATDAVNYVRGMLESAIANPAVEVEIASEYFIPAVKGSSDNNVGTDGEFVYTVTLSSGAGTEFFRKTLSTYSLTIKAEKYNKSQNNYLASLAYSIAGGPLSPIAINDNATTYSVSTSLTAFDGSTIELHAVAKDESATVTTTSATIFGGYASARVTVRSEAGVDRIYNITFGAAYMGGGTSLPGTSLPGTSLPGTSLPGTSLPGTSLPGTSFPTTSLPTTSFPTTTFPTTDVIPPIDTTTSIDTPSTEASTMGTIPADIRYVGNTVRYKTSDRELIPYYIDANGREVQVTISAYDAETGELVFVGNRETSYLYRRSSRTYFRDISSHWARSYIEDVSRLNLFIGTSSGIFSPDLKMTYGMLVTVLGRMSGDEIANDSGYGPYVRWADAKGITRSLPALAENDQISRQDAAVLIMSFARYMGIDESRSSVARFLDGHTISSYAVPSVATLSYHEVINGRDTGNFDPFATLTRAETTVLIVKLIPFVLGIE